MISQQNNAFSFEGSAERQNLELAFRSFSEVSAQLADSYEKLQTHVSELQQELIESNEAKLQASRDKEDLATRLENLLELLPGGVVVLDSYGNVEQCNPAAMDLLGGEIAGRKWTEIIRDNFSPRSDDGHEISLKDGRRVSIATRSMMDLNVKTFNGQIILLTDQTQTRELQGQLARRDRLSTMGKMVAYLAHQIRTPLSSAMLYGGHLKNRDLDESLQIEFSDKLLRNLKNVESQISDLLIFARGSAAAEQRITVSELIERLSQEVTANLAFQNIQVDYHNMATGAVLNCNPEAFISAILNLVNNAREACMEADLNADQDKGLKIDITARTKCNMLQLEITDNGPGINDKDVNRVLEPFYSTKAKGTGLGLAVVQAVVKSLGGSLALASAAEQGLTVKMEIPLEAK